MQQVMISQDENSASTADYTYTFFPVSNPNAWMCDACDVKNDYCGELKCEAETRADGRDGIYKRHAKV